MMPRDDTEKSQYRFRDAYFVEEDFPLPCIG